MGITYDSVECRVGQLARRVDVDRSDADGVVDRARQVIDSALREWAEDVQGQVENEFARIAQQLVEDAAKIAERYSKHAAEEIRVELL